MSEKQPVVKESLTTEQIEGIKKDIADGCTYCYRWPSHRSCMQMLLSNQEQIDRLTTEVEALRKRRDGLIESNNEFEQRYREAKAEALAEFVKQKRIKEAAIQAEIDKRIDGGMSPIEALDQMCRELEKQVEE